MKRISEGLETLRSSFFESLALIKTLAKECTHFLFQLKRNAPGIFFGMAIVLLFTSSMPFAISYVFGLKLDELNSGEPTTWLTILLLAAWGMLQVSEQYEGQIGRKVEEHFKEHYTSRLLRLRTALGLVVFEKSDDTELAKDMELAGAGEYWGPRLLQYMVYMFSGLIRSTFGIVMLMIAWPFETILPVLVLVPLTFIRLHFAVLTAKKERELADNQGRVTSLRSKFTDPDSFKSITLLGAATRLVKFIVGLLKTRTRTLNEVFEKTMRAEVLVTLLLIWTLYVVFRRMETALSAKLLTVGYFSLFWTSLLASIEGLDRAISNLSEMAARVDQLGALSRTEDKYGHLIVDEDEAAIKFQISQISGKVASSRLTVQALSFGYTPADPLFHGVNLTIPKGLTFVLGSNGAGKTTFSNLATGLKAPGSGSILVGDCPIADLSTPVLRRVIAHSPQKPTSWRSVTYRTPFDFIDPVRAQNDEEVYRALDWAGVGGLIRERPQGLDTDDSVWGNAKSSFEFSGGYNARFNLALLYFRLLGKESAIALFDEPFAALDGPTIEELLYRMRELGSNDVSVLLILHQANLIKDTDYVLFVDRAEKKGKPCGPAQLSFGTRLELKATNPRYLAFVERRRDDRKVA